MLDCAENYYHKISFLTNDLSATELGGYPVLHEQDTPFDYIINNFDEVIVAIGNNNARLTLSIRYASCGMKLATIIHPCAVISKYAEIGDGSVVFAHSVINHSAKIGMACIINTGSIIEHDCILADGVHISPNAVLGGTVKIGTKTWVCIGSSVANNVKIGENVTVGAGAVVLKDTPNNVLTAGVPAVIKKRLLR